jgi:Na+:H+ antiporter, NhaC family
MDTPTPRQPSLLQALIPVVFLIGMLAASVYLFGDDSSGGPNQIALILSAAVGIVIGIANGYNWKALERGIVHGISLAMGAILILLMVGALIGSWILAGVVPTMIYYGLALLTPAVFYAAACVICAIVSLATGSSWTTAGTVGVALVGIAAAQDLNLGMAAGAIISGAYFGDKMSPLSDTTNLAPGDGRAPTSSRTSAT